MEKKEYTKKHTPNRKPKNPTKIKNVLIYSSLLNISLGKSSIYSHLKAGSDSRP
ncbi:hypothetical protein CU002_1186 [Enterococcus faecium]|nr:hypothetical protein [Enterococcus faecium]